MIRFVTWGPAGNNHEFATQRYIEHLGLGGQATLSLVPHFEAGVAAVLDHEADCLVQCAVHPDTPAIVARSRDGLYVMDTFISRSRDLAVVRSRAVKAPRALAVFGPTRGYTDLSRWAAAVPAASLMDIADGLRDGRYDAGLTYSSFAEDNADRFVIDEFIPSVDDAWIVYGRVSLSEGGVIAWPDSPAARWMRRTAAA